VFDSVGQTKSNKLSDALTRGLEHGHQAIQDTGSVVAATAIAIRNKRIYVAHAGHTSAFLVRKGGTSLLTKPHNDPLGSSVSPEIETGDPNGMALDPADSIVLASDGLSKRNIEDGKPFVNSEELSSYVEGNAPREAARHLVSLAMGRDVDDNVSVIVIQPRKRQINQKSIWKLAAIPIGLLIVVAVIALARSLVPQEAPVVTTDFGYAVLISGSASMRTIDGESVSVSRLSTIPPKSSISATENTRLALESSEVTTTDLSSVLIYLASDSRVQLLSIDTHQFSESEERNNLVLQTTFTLDLGRVLLLRGSGTRSIQILFTDGAASMVGSGHAAMAVDFGPGEVVVDCLQGNCEFKETSGEPISLQPGFSISLNRGDLGNPEEVRESSLLFWDELCGGCISVP
jgi:hypothetical protein